MVCLPCPFLDHALEAARKAGAEHIIDARAQDPVEAIRELTKGGAPVSIDALGIAETCVNSVRSLRKRGRHVQIGHTTRAEAGYVPLPIDEILLNELELYGAFGIQGQRYGTMLAMCEAGTLDPGALVSRTVGLDGVTGVLEDMGRYDMTGIVAIDFKLDA
ncbi:zinc-binding dehydrogenase [Sphingomonas oleivorans]|uniref:zinc-binding dehydrogenase n=1 Tax=Sphingomonas oleivorans TaxID=1735121 RepID=UPI001A9EE91A|nr:zinc-binding dehydrogenase [Sphingomonas oleivorans]